MGLPDELRLAFIGLACLAIGALLWWFGLMIRDECTETERENAAYYACRAECMSTHRVSKADIVAGRCFCALKPGNGWDELPSEWVEVHP